MPSTGALLAFGLTALVIIAIPGPSVLFTVSRALTVGRRAALVTVLGNALGECMQVVLVACGVGALVGRSIAVYTVVKLAGAAYLIYLGAQAIRRRGEIHGVSGGPGRRKLSLRVLSDGFIVGATNPKSIVFFVAVLPQFVSPRASHPAAALLVLGALFLAIALLSDTVWALAAGTARTWLSRSPRRMAAIGGAGGVAMVGIGTSLLFARRPPN